MGARKIGCLYITAAVITLITSSALPALAQDRASPGAFSGSAKEQARCLLRRVKKFGEVERPMVTLPAPLDRLIGESTEPTIAKPAFRRYLASQRSTRKKLVDHCQAKCQGPRTVSPPRISLSTIRVVPLWNVVKRFHRQEWTRWRGRETIYNPVFTRCHVRNAGAIHAQCVNRWRMSSLIVWASLRPGTTLSRVSAQRSMKDKPPGAGACSSRWKTSSLGVATRGASTQKLLLQGLPMHS